MLPSFPSVLPTMEHEDSDEDLGEVSELSFVESLVAAISPWETWKHDV